MISVNRFCFNAVWGVGRASFVSQVVHGPQLARRLLILCSFGVLVASCIACIASILIVYST